MKLRDICDIIYGKALKKSDRVAGPVPVYGSNGVVDYHSEALFEGPTIVVGRKGSAGAVEWSDSSCWIIDTAFSVRPRSDDVDLRWLYWALKYLDLGKLQKHAAVPGISKGDVLREDILLPPLAEQQRIAEILDTSAEVIQNEEFLRDEILPLAINLVDNKVASGSGTLDEFIDSMSSGKNLAESTDPNQQNHVLKVSAVTSGTFKPEESKPLPDSYDPPTEHQVRIGDVLVSRANTSQLLGASALVTSSVDDLYLPDKIWRIVPKEGVDPYLLWGVLQTKTVRARISQRATGSSGSMKNISQKNFLQVPCATFSEEDGTELATLIRETISLHSQVEKKLSLLHGLHNSLSARAFVGQL